MVAAPVVLKRTTPNFALGGGKTMRSYLLLRRVVAGYVERLEGMGVCVPCRLAFRDMAMRAIRKNHDGEMQLQDAYGEMMRAYYIATSCSFRIEERSRRDETE